MEKSWDAGGEASGEETGGEEANGWESEMSISESGISRMGGRGRIEDNEVRRWRLEVDAERAGNGAVVVDVDAAVAAFGGFSMVEVRGADAEATAAFFLGLFVADAAIFIPALASCICAPCIVWPLPRSGDTATELMDR